MHWLNTFFRGKKKAVYTLLLIARQVLRAISVWMCHLTKWHRLVSNSVSWCFGRKHKNTWSSSPIFASGRRPISTHLFHQQQSSILSAVSPSVTSLGGNMVEGGHECQVSSRNNRNRFIHFTHRAKEALALSCYDGYGTHTKFRNSHQR